MPISIGKMPEGAIKINKAIIDSDLDGVVSGALLKNIFGDIKIVLTEPKKIQQGLIDKEVDKNTVIADLGYIKGCGLYFDHHQCNKPDFEIVGKWVSAPSAAGVIFNLYKDEFDLEKYKELVCFVDKFDSGIISKEQIECADFLTNLAFSITRKDKAFGEAVTEALWKMESLEEFKKLPFIEKRIDKFKKLKEEYQKYILENVEIADNIVFVDNRNSTSGVAHAYFVDAIYLECDVVVMIKADSKDSSLISMSLTRNSFNPNLKEYNLLPIVNDLNPEVSGGHSYACGVLLPKNIGLDEAKHRIIDYIRDN